MNDAISHKISVEAKNPSIGLTVGDLVQLTEFVTALNIAPTVPLKARVGFKWQVRILEVDRG
jgi:hypothetical protein